MKHILRTVMSLATLAFAFFNPAQAQTGDQQPSAPPQAQMARGEGDPIRQLNLSPEQREQIRAIREENRSERAAINSRVGEANRQLELALDSDTPDEAVVEQRMREVAAAQAAAMRMRILTEVKIRRVLTAEQRSLLRSLRMRARDVRRERRREGPADRLRRREERTLRMENQRNGMGPLLRRRNAQRPPRP
ncbi:MAG TPA: Spy/CpxP family protein refolding chaperone [Pyrinomonadaceae bacterium]|nr:Spy/CpxP family protein refolding chaperone [Pyrinomonadaceae bacterium]